MTKDAIVDAAFRVWGRGYFQRMSLASLAEDLGCTKPALYRHFDGKDALEDAMHTAYYDRLAAFLRPHYEEALGMPRFEDALVTLALAFGAFFARRRDLFLFTLIRLYGSDRYHTDCDLKDRGIIFDRFTGADWETATNAHPPQVQLVMAAMIDAVNNFHLLDGGDGEDERLSVFLHDFEVTIRRGLGLYKDRVECIDFAALEAVVLRGGAGMDGVDGGETGAAVKTAAVKTAAVKTARQEFLNAIGETLAEVGPTGATVELFARKLGKSKSSLYTHFKNRDEMILSLFESEVTQIIHEAARYKPESDVPEEQLYLALFAAARYLQRRTMILRVLEKVRKTSHEETGDEPPSPDLIRVRQMRFAEMMNTLFSGITLPCHAGTGDVPYGGEGGVKTIGARDSAYLLFLLVNTLMFRPSGADYGDIGVESFRRLFRFFTLGLSGIKET